MRYRRTVVQGLAGALLIGLTTIGVADPATAAIDRSPIGPDIEAIKKALESAGSDVQFMAAAHRGQWRTAPENSLGAIEDAIDGGAEIVELDVRVTQDNVPVLMHDETVDRTTDGAGRIEDLTLDEVKQLRLKGGLGGDDAEVTEAQVPTLAEVMEVLRDRAMINLDKGWPFREQILRVLQETDTVDHGIFKGSPTVAEAEDFMASNPDIYYMHIVGDDDAEEAFAFEEEYQPVAVEVTFDSLEDPQAQPEYLDRLEQQGRVWMNSMWGSLAAGHTDETALRDDVELGWEPLVDELNASIIQTDNMDTMDYWRHGEDPAQWGLLPDERSIRVQAEEPIPGGQGVGYHDTDNNQCDSVSPDEPMLDICDQRGASVLGYIRGGEWVKYAFEVPSAGNYNVSARVSSPYAPAGTVSYTWNGEPGAVQEIANTTSHNAFERQHVENRYFEAGTHELLIEMPDDAYQNFNIDYFQLDRVSSGEVPGADGDIRIEADIPGLSGSDEPGEGEGPGSLVLSVNEGAVEMGEQRHAGDRLRAYGVLPAVGVTDTRVDGQGWAVSAQSSDLVSDTATVGAGHLGWKPHVEASSNGAVPGSAVASLMSGGEGLAAPQSLGSADADMRLGTTELGADIELEVPVDTESGTYKGALSLSLFPVD